MLGTVAQYPAEMGRIAVESALKIINGESVPEYVPVKIDMFTKANL
jgi:ABC-type sugar transport system substrate-binding protein